MMNKKMTYKKLTAEELAMVVGGREEKPKGPFICKVCGKSFSTITAIACHCSAEHH